MNSIIKGYYPLFPMYQALRDQMMEIVDDEDLGFRPGGDNPTLGFLCRENGQVQRSYIESFRTFKQDFSLLKEEPELEASLQRLSSWFKELDQELKAALENLTEEEIENKKIDRGGGFVLSPRIQLEVYKEALLIFYGKASVYLKALGKVLPEQWQEWIS